ncbi:MAG: UDP-glucose 4-epimerase [Candidatus Sumerlaeota bacterium]|nr:UDP-glucose 4-epimerase [Candidatus Sumerlaeota bacterium]
MTQRTSLLTGGAGFIGSHLAHKLLEKGNRVIVLDDLSTGKFSNIEELDRQYGPDGRFKFIFDTVLHERVVEDLVREADEIYHLASAVGVNLIMEEPVRTIETIVGGTHAVLRCAARYRRRTMIFSTSEVYGKSMDVPFREDGDRLEGATSRHRWAYACAKSLDEFLALAHWKQTRLPVIVVRLFNTAGPRQTGQYGMVIPSFVRRALTGAPLSVYGTGEQSRCFCHVSDVVEAIEALMGAEGATGEVFNIGSTQEITILDLARKIVALTKSSSPIELVPYESVYGADGFEDMQRRLPCIDKIGRAIGWKPRRSLDEIITDVAAEAK